MGLRAAPLCREWVRRVCVAPPSLQYGLSCRRLCMDHCQLPNRCVSTAWQRPTDERHLRQGAGQGFLGNQVPIATSSSSTLGSHSVAGPKQADGDRWRCLPDSRQKQTDRCVYTRAHSWPLWPPSASCRPPALPRGPIALLVNKAVKETCVVSEYQVVCDANHLTGENPLPGKQKVTEMSAPVMGSFCLDFLSLCWNCRRGSVSDISKKKTFPARKWREME